MSIKEGGLCHFKKKIKKFARRRKKTTRKKTARQRRKRLSCGKTKKAELQSLYTLVPIGEVGPVSSNFEVVVLVPIGELGPGGVVLVSQTLLSFGEVGQDS